MQYCTAYSTRNTKHNTKIQHQSCRIMEYGGNNSCARFLEQVVVCLPYVRMAPAAAGYCTAGCGRSPPLFVCFFVCYFQLLSFRAIFYHHEENGRGIKDEFFPNSIIICALSVFVRWPLYKREAALSGAACGIWRQLQGSCCAMVSQMMSRYIGMVDEQRRNNKASLFFIEISLQVYTSRI